MISRYDIQKIQDLPIEQVAEALEMTVSRHRTLCPFHEDRHPSLLLNTRSNRYRCYACGAHGSSIDLVIHMLHLTFPEACHWLAQKFGVSISDERVCHFAEVRPIALHPVHKDRPEVKVDVPYLSMLMAQPVIIPRAAHFLYSERHIAPSVVRWLGLSSIEYPTPMSGAPCEKSYFNAPSLLIPYRDMDGQLISVQSRYLGTPPMKGEKGEGVVTRFQFPKGNKCQIFNLPILKQLKEGDQLYISEGVSDCMALLSAGCKSIAIPSATLLKDDDVALLRTMAEETHITYHIFPDADLPGEKLYLELRRKLSPCSLVRHQLPPGIKDFGQYWMTRNVNC